VSTVCTISYGTLSRHWLRYRTRLKVKGIQVKIDGLNLISYDTPGHKPDAMDAIERVRSIGEDRTMLTMLQH
jgi:hypothetical protein